MNKNYRIHTNIIKDSLLQVNMRQDFDFMEILSLKLSQRDAYKIHSSNYGVIIGRVLANDAFGIPNAKVSVFIERDNNDTTELESIYPYSDINGRDKEGRRYNLLPDYSDDECYRIVGTFPNKRLLLDDSTYLEVYDKYWKYSTVTNNAGDYMIFGVPVGNQQIHVDIDMSDIGVLSQKPRDYIYKGYTESLFDSSTQFKSSTNLDNLTQIFSQNKSVYVYPFWGDAENGIAAITRADVQINYKFEPTCVFIGSIVSDNDGNAIDHKCGATIDSGRNDQLVAGEGTIEMIRKTQDGLVEEYPINGNRLIDSDGVWCYQIPMNLDFVGTDEYGNIIPTDNPKKGIPTRSQVRFRISKTETGGEGHSMHTAKYLVPMNPVLDEEKVVPTTKEENGQDVEKMYLFGSNTPQSCFRDLYWNNVYSVKNFIPKTQTASRAYSPYYNGLKAGNIVDNQNPIPFNKLEIQMSFTYMFICLLYTLLVAIVTLINATVIVPINFIISILNTALDLIPFFSPPDIPYIPCIHLNVGPNSDNAIFFPGCDDRGKEDVDCPEDMPNCYKSSNSKKLMDLIQYSLSEEYDTVRLDLYQDWINGCLYMPLWFWKKSKKKKFLFFTIRSAKDEYCSCDREYDRLKTVHTCSIDYATESLGAPLSRVPTDEKKWHRDRRKGIYFRNGLIKSVENNDGLKAYYYAGYQLSSNDKTPISDIKQIKNKFEIVRLFATDIILLGNLNESNIYGIPQLFNNLPSTTANIPPIATIQEDMDGANEDTSSDLEHDNGLAGKTIITGMDWGYDGAEDAPVYKNGLFMDLSCFTAATRSKTCINVERMAELGVSLDMSYKMSYPKGGDLTDGVISSDGFINKWEINDNNARAMFATLNHVGFMPQDYQTDKGMYETQIMDNNTGYLIPKFKYTYPVDFDGRMEEIMRDYENGFAQSLTDTRDEAYITFRLGAEAKGVHGRKRHFYYTNGSDSYEMPLYNNSFYFYFGINKGNTAIDKFNKKFIAPCVNGSKKPFSIDITTQGKVECKCMYKDKEYRNPYIKINMDDIQTPFSYELIDANNNKVAEENSKTLTEFKIPDLSNKDTSGVAISNQVYTLKVTDANGKKLSQRINVDTPKVSIDYETQRLGSKFYNITETRVDNICSDKTMFYGILRIKSFTIDGYQFKITNIEAIGYDDTTNSYIIKLTGFNELTDVFYNNDANLDGDECASDRPNKENLNQVIVYVSTLENKTSEVSTASTTNGVRNCFCDKQNPIAVEQRSTSGIDIKTSLTNSKCWLGHKFVIPAIDETVYYGEKDGDNGAKKAIDNYNEGKSEADKLSYDDIYEIAEFYAYQPNTFVLTISQWCNNQIVSSNTVSETAIIQNGENFNAYLNKMPIRFMIGTLNDSKDGAIMNKSNFYRTDVVTNPNNDGLNGWFGVHEEDTYKFARTDDKNRSVWSDYVTLNTNISSNSAKKAILKFKFDAMFSVADATYVTTNSSLKYQYRAEGGVGAPLNRLLAPEYDYSKLNGDNNYIYKYSDRSSVTCDSSYPNIVGNNYKGYGACDGDYGPLFNMFMCDDCIDSWLDECDKDYEDCELCTLQGNYFAAFSNNGGYINTKEIKEDIPVSKIPTLAKVSVVTPTKIIGKDRKDIKIDDVQSVYNKTDDSLPYFRAMFVDRRLDFDLNILAPSISNFIRLYESTEKEVDGKIVYVPSSKENIWRGSRISGTTYGGIEMSYYDESYKINESTEDTSEDVELEEYDILSASYNEDASSAEQDNILEYTINYSDTPGEDAVTHFNKKPKIPRRLYEAELNGVNIKNFFWSDSRKEALIGIVDSDDNSLKSGNFYFYKYPKNVVGLYNGDFMRDTVVVSEEYGNISSYPTKRYIDVGNLPMVGGYSSLSLVSCGYNMRPKIDSDSGKLKIKAVKGEKIELDFNFQAPITMVTPNSENETFGNITYKFDNKFSDDFGWIHVKAELATTTFKINMYECEGFKVYNYTPRIIRVLPYIDGIDGISYYKTVTSTGNEDDTYKATGSLASAIEDVTVHMFKDIGGDSLFDILLNRGDIFSSEHIEHNDWYYNNLGGTTGGNFLAKGDTGDDPQILMSNETIWNNITFDTTFELNDTQIFTILLERNFEPAKNENLTKHIHTVETSSLFDARPLVFQIDENYTYVEMIPVAVETTISEEGSENPPDADSTGQSHIQTIGFKFRFKKNAKPTESNCEAFGDYKSMSYKFIFTNGEGEKFTINSSEIESEEDDNYTYISIKVKWTQDMGIAYDNEWQNGINLTILAKTRENFIYKITELTYAFGGFVDSGVSYDPETKRSNMEPNQPYKCKINFLP